MEIAGVVPVYNGSKTLPKIIERVPWDEIDIIFAVDDGSEDESWKTLKRIEREHEKFTALKHEDNKGYGGAQKTLYDKVLEREMDIAVMFHQDGHYPPEKIPKVIDPIKENPEIEVVLAPRTNMLEGGYPVHRYAGNRIISKIQNTILGLDLFEYHTGFRAYSSDILNQIDYHNCTDEFHFDTEIIGEIRKKGLRDKITQIPLDMNYRDNTRKNERIFSYSFNCLLSSIKYRLQIEKSRFL